MMESAWLHCRSTGLHGGECWATWWGVLDIYIWVVELDGGV